MKRYIIKTIVFISPILICFVGMEIILRQIPNDYAYKNKYLNENANKVETLMLGSSHSFYGLNPEYFKNNAFNASHISQSLDYDYEILMKYKTDFKNLETIYLPVSYFTLWGRLGKDIESWRCKNYVLYYNIKSTQSIKHYFEVMSYKFSKNVKFATDFIIKGKDNLNCSNLGWGTRYKSENSKDLVKTGKAAALRHTRDNIESLKEKNIYTENKVILNKILEWSKLNNIEVILFTPPAFVTYRENLDSKQLDLTIKTTKEIASKHDNCIYVNMISDTTFLANDFYDADHLSDIGAKKISEKLDALNP